MPASVFRLRPLAVAVLCAALLAAVPGRHAHAAAAPSAVRAVAARTFRGLPSVGVLYTVGHGMRSHHCTASVVHSPQHDVILTAAHCAAGPHSAFVPMYTPSQDAGHQPYGVWKVGGSWRPAGWRAFGPGSDLDVAFLRLRPDGRGRNVEDLTGGNRLARTGGYTHRVTVVGYPTAGSHNPADRAVRCSGRTTRLAGFHQMRFACRGLWGGTSGSPWLTGIDSRTGLGTVIGEIGGLNRGGPPVGNDRVSYSPLYGTPALRLYDAAARG